MTTNGNAARRSGRTLLQRLVRRYRASLLVVSLTSLVGALVEAGFLVLLTGLLLAAASGAPTTIPVAGRDVDVRIGLILGAAAVLLRLGLNIATVRVSARLAAQVMRDERHRLAEAYLTASWSTQQAQRSGILQDLLTTFVNRVNGAVAAVAQGLTSGLSLLAFLSAGFLVNATATLAILGALAFLGLVLIPFRRSIRRNSEVAVGDSLEFASHVAEFGSLGLEMQAFGVTEEFSRRITALTVRTSESFRRMQFLVGSLSPIYTFLAYLALLSGTASIVAVGVGNTAAIGSVMLLMLRSLSYGQQLTSVMGNIASFLPAIDELETTLDKYRESRASRGTARPASLFPVSFQSVGYRYPNGRNALAAVDFRIEQGEMIGVIGPSGSGKSTLAQLLLGVRAPTDGHITVGGTNIQDVDREWFTDLVSFVPQEPLLFTGTVSENLRFLRSGIETEMLVKAAADANILEEVMGLQEGLETHLGERGGTLSGGQRQRVCFARALVAEPRFLVLDEPTSSLDAESERLIRQTLAGLRGHVTMFIIAHRMSTLELCDRIMIIEDGNLIGFDTPSNLQNSSEFYRAAQALTVVNP